MCILLLSLFSYWMAVTRALRFDPCLRIESLLDAMYLSLEAPYPHGEPRWSKGDIIQLYLTCMGVWWCMRVRGFANALSSSRHMKLSCMMFSSLLMYICNHVHKDIYIHAHMTILLDTYTCISTKYFNTCKCLCIYVSICIELWYAFVSICIWALLCMPVHVLHPFYCCPEKHSTVNPQTNGKPQ